MNNERKDQVCTHQVALVGSLIVTHEEFGQAARAFYLKVADFNIRGVFDQVEHPGFLSEFEFCPKCGEKLNSKINRDEFLFEAINNYDCQGRPRLEIQKAKEIEMLKKTIDTQSINDSMRLYFVLTREATFYKDHPNYRPIAICYTGNTGERVTLIGDDACDCIDKAILNENNSRQF